MKLEQLTVQLRLRSSWEAIELGMALVRRDAAAIWKPWCLVTLPVLALVNALGWAWDLIGLAGFVMWWLKPVFDRIPLYVISRSVFAATPTVRDTLRAQWRWGWKPMLHYLTWRRLSPARSLFLPVDLLEGVQGGRLRERRRVLGGAVYGNAALLTLICMHFEVAIGIASLAAIAMFTPLELLPETLRTTWTLLFEQSPAWVNIGLNVVAWLAVSIIEPFFVGAGFGLYLNRRTELEAWDVEIVFRKLRQRLAAGATLAMLVMAVVLLPHSAPVHAQEASPPPAASTPAAGNADTTPNLPAIFGEHYRDDARFRKAATQAYRDPSLNRTRVQKAWERREKPEEKPPETGNWAWLGALAGIVAFIGEWGLWIIAALIVLALLLTARYWLPWMRGSVARVPRLDNKAKVEPIAAPLPLPDDVAAVARRLWREGQHRDALALIYRAGVVALARRLHTTLPPGATEAECLRASRRLEANEDRQLFARIVRVWQYAAYAQRDPEEAEFEALLQQLQQRGGWLA